jgi:uncharacterized protein
MSQIGGPQRTCLGCRVVLDKDSLIRYVMAADGAVLVDYRQKLPGRGAYTCVKRSCVEEAVRRNQFARAFRGRNQRPQVEELTAEISRQLAEKVENLLGMARKSGAVVEGSSLVLSALDKQDELAAVIAAGDMSEGIFEKVQRKCRVAKVPLFVWGNKESLGQRLGREERSVIGLKRGHLAAALQQGLERYEQFVGEI